MAPACGLWIAWPKKASRRPTDMTDQVVREIALPTGLVDNKVCAIDETWYGAAPGHPPREPLGAARLQPVSGSPSNLPRSSRYSSSPTPLGSRKYMLLSAPRSGPR